MIAVLRNRWISHSLLEQGSVLLFSLILTILLFAWLGFDYQYFDSAFIGDEQDTWLNSWTIYQGMDNLLNRPNDLGYSTMLYGEKNSFFYSIAPYGISIVSLPVYLLSGQNLELTYNLYLFATFLLTAWATYLLVRYLLDVPYSIALVAVVLLTFSPLRIKHIGHIETLSFQYYLFALYGLHRLLDNPRKRWGVLMAVCFGLCFTTSGYLAMIFVVHAGVLISFYRWAKPHSFNKRFFLNLALSACIAGAMCAPFILYRMSIPAVVKGFSTRNVVDLAPSLQTIFASPSFVYRHIQVVGGSQYIFPGLLPTALSYLAWRYRHDFAGSETSVNGSAGKTPPSRTQMSHAQVVLVYTVVGLVGWVLAFGPQLRVGDILLPMPFLLLRQVPGFASLRAVGRFAILSAVATSFLSAYILKLIYHRWRRSDFYIALGVLSVFLGIEFTPYHGIRSETLFNALLTSPQNRIYHTEPLTPSAEVYQWLAELPKDTPIAYYPFTGDNRFRYFAYARFHNQPMLNGTTSYLPGWLASEPWGSFPNQPTLNILQEHHIRYVLVYNSELDVEDQTEFREIMLNASNGYIEFIYLASLLDELGELVDIYEISSTLQRARGFIYYDFDDEQGINLYPPVIRNETDFRWLGPRPEATLIFPQLVKTEGLVFEMRIDRALQEIDLSQLQVWVNNTPLEITINTTTISRAYAVSAPLPSDLDIRSSKYTQIDIIVPQTVLSGDGIRSLSIALDWLRIGPPRPYAKKLPVPDP